LLINSYSYVATYTINAANTFEYKTISIPALTAGTPTTPSNTTYIQARWDLGCGSTVTTGTANSWVSGTYFKSTGTTNLITTAGATFYITGVQLEVGSIATGFEYVDYSTQLLMCQRYCQALPAIDYEFSLPVAANYVLNGRLLATMRATPTVTTQPTVSISTNATGVTILPRLVDAFILSINLTSVNTGSRVATGTNGILSAEL